MMRYKDMVEDAKAKGLTSEELAERSGVNASQIAKLEKGYNSPSVATLTKLAEVLGAEIRLIVKG